MNRTFQATALVLSAVAALALPINAMAANPGQDMNARILDAKLAAIGVTTVSANQLTNAEVTSILAVVDRAPSTLTAQDKADLVWQINGILAHQI